jgi:hypothetical protein
MLEAQGHEGRNREDDGQDLAGDADGCGNRALSGSELA